MWKTTLTCLAGAPARTKLPFAKPEGLGGTALVVQGGPDVLTDNLQPKIRTGLEIKPLEGATLCIQTNESRLISHIVGGTLGVDRC